MHILYIQCILYNQENGKGCQKIVVYERCNLCELLLHSHSQLPFIPTYKTIYLYDDI